MTNGAASGLVHIITNQMAEILVVPITPSGYKAYLRGKKTLSDDLAGSILQHSSPERIKERLSTAGIISFVDRSTSRKQLGFVPKLASMPPIKLLSKAYCSQTEAASVVRSTF